MKKIMILAVFIVVMGVMSVPSYASDWDKAGKALTVIEGVRVLTGGKVDVIGNITGINNQPRYAHNRPQSREFYRRDVRYRCNESVWVPHFKYKRAYVPEHEEYDGRYGKVIVEGHYIRYTVEAGGHWEAKDFCD